MGQRFDRDMDLGTFTSLGPILACPRTQLRRGLQRAAVDADRGRLAFALNPLAEKRTYMLHQQPKAAPLQLALAADMR